MITYVTESHDDQSLCWVCTHYKCELLFGGPRPLAEHICKKGNDAGDDVWVCKKFRRKYKQRPSAIRLAVDILYFWRREKTRDISQRVEK